MPIKQITSGNKIVVNSGSVISYGGNSIDVEWENGVKTIFSLTPSTDEIASLNIGVKDGDLEIKVGIPKDNALGLGSQEPIPIGQSENSKQMFVHFRIYSLQASSDYLLHYTFYMEQ